MSKKIYRLVFKKTDTDYSSNHRPYAEKKNKYGKDDRIYLNADKSLFCLEEEIKKFWEFGEGVEECKHIADMDEAYFKPVLFEPDFIDQQIKSKKNGETVGFQG